MFYTVIELLLTKEKPLIKKSRRGNFLSQRAADGAIAVGEASLNGLMRAGQKETSSA